MPMLNLAYEEFGSPTCPPVIILHGFFASARNWRSIAKLLSEQYHVFVLDQRNHGASPHAPHMDYPSMAQDVQQFIQAQQLESVHIIGHSMGGKVAMWLALQHPELLGKVIIVDIAPVTYQHSFDTMIDALCSLPLEELANRKQADDFLSERIPDSSFRQFLLQNLVLENGNYQWRIDLNIFKQAAPGIIAFPETGQLSPCVKALKVLAGGNSQFVKPDSFAAIFPHADIEFLPGAGHWLHVEVPELFLQQVRSYLG